MDLTPAPFLREAAGGPVAGQAFWCQAADGLRLRLALWRPETTATPARGTVLLFPGRTEYVEKYADAATHLALRGYTTLAVDWRGQGLADRMLDDARLGHVDDFADYQHDVDAALAAVRALDLPAPLHLLAHSMGGCIGLRAVMRGLPVASCAFSGPMWGIHITAALRPVVKMLIAANLGLGRGGRLMPTTSPDSYVATAPFDDNTLTTDPAMFQMMKDHLAAEPALALGGPTVGWMRAALRECDLLAALPAPDLPCLTLLGGNERIVDTARIHARMAAWPGGRLDLVPGAEHEVLMEGPALRARLFDQLDMFFAAAGGVPAVHHHAASTGA